MGSSVSSVSAAKRDRGWFPDHLLYADQSQLLVRPPPAPPTAATAALASGNAQQFLADAVMAAAPDCLCAPIARLVTEFVGPFGAPTQLHLSTVVRCRCAADSDRVRPTTPTFLRAGGCSWFCVHAACGGDPVADDVRIEVAPRAGMQSPAAHIMQAAIGVTADPAHPRLDANPDACGFFLDEFALYAGTTCTPLCDLSGYDWDEPSTMWLRVRARENLLEWHPSWCRALVVPLPEALRGRVLWPAVQVWADASVTYQGARPVDPAAKPLAMSRKPADSSRCAVM